MFGRMTWQEWRQKLSSVRYQQERVKTKLPKLQKSVFTFTVNIFDEVSKRYKTIKLQAWTKSEFRAMLKNIIGIIPKGLIITKLD
jgi:hypothetical protein